jgi:uncharacterized protein with HEPN domain
MRPEERDPGLLWDIVDHAKAVVGFVAGKTFADFERDRILRQAVERSLEVVGEAAGHVSPTFRDAHPEIPWRRLVGLRNILAHDYGGVLVAKVWEIAIRSVPELLAQVEPLVPPPPEEP